MRKKRGNGEKGNRVGIGIERGKLIKVLMILSETFSIKEGEKKIFLISSMNIPKEIKEAEFWIKYLECEIDIESKNKIINELNDKIKKIENDNSLLLKDKEEELKSGKEK